MTKSERLQFELEDAEVDRNRAVSTAKTLALLLVKGQQASALDMAEDILLGRGPESLKLETIHGANGVMEIQGSGWPVILLQQTLGELLTKPDGTGHWNSIETRFERAPGLEGPTVIVTVQNVEGPTPAQQRQDLIDAIAAFFAARGGTIADEEEAVDRMRDVLAAMPAPTRPVK